MTSRLAAATPLPTVLVDRAVRRLPHSLLQKELTTFSAWTLERAAPTLVILAVHNFVVSRVCMVRKCRVNVTDQWRTIHTRAL